MARRWRLSKKETKKLKKELTSRYPCIPLEFSIVEKIVDKEVGEILVVDNIPALYIYSEKYYPLLTLLLAKGYQWLPYVVVDSGAVKPLLRGADVMAPGIQRIEGVFGVDEPVVVVEEKYLKPFVVARSLVDSSTLASMKHGRVLENIHRIGDKIWKYIRSL